MFYIYLIFFFTYRFVFLALMEYALVNIVMGDGPDAPPTQKNDNKKKGSKGEMLISHLLGDKVMLFYIIKVINTQITNILFIIKL